MQVFQEVNNMEEREDEYLETMSKDEGLLELEMGYGSHNPEVVKAVKENYGASLNLSNLPIELLTKNVDSLSAEEFTNIRRQGFGGSDSSMLLGVNPYQGEQELINSKTLPYLPDTPEKRNQLAKEKQVGQLSSVRKGNDLEPLIIKKASEALKIEIIKPTDMYRFKEYPYLTMNFDGVGIFSKGHDFAFVGKHHGYAPVEIKVATIKGQNFYQVPKAIYSETRLYQGLEPWQKAPPPLTDEQLKTWDIARKADYFGIPKYYYTQVQQEMMALDAEGGFIAILFEVDWHVQIFYVQKDPYVWNALKIKGYEYWNRVQQIIARYAPNEAEKMQKIVKVDTKSSLSNKKSTFSNIDEDF